MPLDPSGILQATGLAQSQALKIIGGIPILKNASGSTLEKLKLPKHVDPGNIKGLLSQVMSGGLSSVMQNPLGAIQGKLSATIATATAQVSSLTGGGGLATALGGLSTSVGNLSALAANLSGFTNTPGLPNSFDLLGHVGVAQGFGDAIPPALSIDTVMAPITMGPALDAFDTQIAAIAAGLSQGAMTIEAATTAIAGMTAAVTAADTGARTAITTLQAAGPALMAVQVAVASQLPGAMPAAVQTGLRAAFRPDVLPTIDAWITERDAEIMAPPTG